MRPTSHVRSDELEVLAANEAFYEALQASDLARMEELWWHENWVRCLHPGWNLIFGWESVQESWATIFRSGMQMQVSISRPLVQVLGDTAWISCIERLTSTSEDDFTVTSIEATNIFVRRNGRWRMVHHHTTLLPSRAPAGSTRSVQ